MKTLTPHIAFVLMYIFTIRSAEEFYMTRLTYLATERARTGAAITLDTLSTVLQYSYAAIEPHNDAIIVIITLT